MKPIADINWVSRPYRLLSLQASRVFVWLRISAAQVTAASLVVILASAFPLIWLSDTTLILSAILCHIFILLDHVDGEVARVNRHLGRPEAGGPAGAYFDLLVHFFQGAAFYSSLGVGLAIHTETVAWAAIGIALGVSASGFPWLVAQYAALGWVRTLPSLESVRRVSDQVNRHSLLEEGVRWESYLIPRSFAEIKWLLKQAFSFPMSMVLFSLCAAADVTIGAEQDYVAVKLYLASFATMRVPLTVLAIRKYLRVLGELDA